MEILFIEISDYILMIEMKNTELNWGLTLTDIQFFHSNWLSRYQFGRRSGRLQSVEASKHA